VQEHISVNTTTASGLKRLKSKGKRGLRRRGNITGGGKLKRGEKRGLLNKESICVNITAANGLKRLKKREKRGLLIKEHICVNIYAGSVLKKRRKQSVRRNENIKELIDKEKRLNNEPA
jgi:shikimate kinase